MKHGKGIPGAVADCQHQPPAVQMPAALDFHAGDPSVPDAQVLHLAFKAHFATQSDNLLPHPFHYPAKNICSYMRFRLITDTLLRAEFHESLQHYPVPAILILHQRVQLPVRKSSRAALAKLHVGGRIQPSILPERLHIPLPFLHAFPPFQQYRPITVHRQEIAAEQSRRPCSHNDNGQSAHAASRFRETVNLLLGFAYQVLFPLESAQNPALLFHLQIQRVNIENLRLLPGVDGLADYPHLPDVPRRNPQHPRGLCFYVGS